MANSRQLYELVDAGLEVLVAGLRIRILPYSQQDQFKNDREQFLQIAASHIETYQGLHSPACALGQWCLQAHKWLQTRARDTSLTAEIALCDLERMQALADFLGMDDVKDDLQVFVSHAAADAGDGADFEAVSGGYGSLAALLAAAGTAFAQRLTELAPPLDLDAAPEDEAWRRLADRDFMSRYLIDGSRDRIEQCLALAQMAMLLRDFLHLDLSISPQAASADAQRLGNLGELLGIERWPPPARAAREQSSAATAVDVSDAPAQTEGLVIDLSAVDAAREAGRQEAQTEEPPPRAPASAPPADLEAEAFPTAQKVPQDGARSSGVMRLALTLGVAVGSVALLTLFVARPPSLGEPFATWWQAARSLWPGGEAPAVVVPAATEEARPAPTPTPVTVADILQPTATFTPVPTPSAVPPSARVDLALYAWPDAQAETAGSIASGMAVAPVRRVGGAEEDWLELDNGRFVLAEGIQNAPADLPVIDRDDLDAGASFARPDDEPLAATSDGATVVNREAYVYLHANCGKRTDIADRYEKGTEIVPVRRVRGAAQDWLELNNGHFVLAEAVDDVPDDLPAIDRDDLDDGSSFAQPPAAASGEAAVVNRGAYVYSRPSCKDNTADSYEERTEIVPVRRVRGAEEDWLELDNGRFVLAEAVDNAPDDLPLADAP